MTDKTAAPAAFDLSELDASDEAVMEVYANGKPTGWLWTFAGPGHPKAIEQSNRLAKERLRKEREIEQAQVNGRKYKATEETVDEALERNVRMVTDRLIGWSAIQMGGKDFPFTIDNAKALLMDRRKGQLLIQALEFLGDERSFTPRSANS
ncbi:branched-chain amino acid ABC transporter [Stappia sp.]|uniref:branched-chain amino acid ABC transporter n=1 Tax=Stappia sp. TaxID=1870903 RepID=UPI003C79E928